MSKRKSEKLANGSADIDHENSEENSEEVEDTKDSRASKRVSKQTKEKADKKKTESSRSSRKRSPSKSLKEDEESETEYEVLKIVDVKTDKKGKKQFLVNWKGYSSKDNSWEPEENLSCNDLIEEFYKEAKTKSPKKTEKAASKSPRGKKKKAN